MTVPAVTEVCRWHSAHSQSWRRSSTQARRPPQPGQANPSGQREAARYSRQAASVAKRSWKSMIVAGQSGRGIGRTVERLPDGTGYALGRYHGAGAAGAGRERVLVEHAKKGVDHRRAELRPGVGLELLDGLLERHRVAVGAVGRHGVEGVAAADDGGAHRDLVAHESVWVAGAVPLLVRGAHYAADLAQQPAHAVEHPLALDGVRLDHDPLVLGERPGLVDDLLRHGDLAHVVQQSPKLNVAALGWIQPHRVG